MVRFADAPMTEVSRTIAASPEQLWPLVTDIALPVGQSDELQASSWLDGAEGPAEGARFEGRNRRGEMEWTTVSTITSFVPPRSFAWAVGDVDDAIARWGFDLEAGEDGTTVRQWVVLGPGRSGLTWAIKQNPEAEEAIIDGRLRQLRASMEANLEALTALVASGG